jgi:DNA-binding NarL/FixJ family response regulator
MRDDIAAADVVGPGLCGPGTTNRPIAEPKEKEHPALPRILLVDDDPHYRAGLAAALTSVGHTVLEADCGLRVPEIAISESIDLVITDIVMPECDGLEVIMTMSRAKSKIPVIAISGVSQHGSYLRTAQRLGAAAVVSKEESPAVLIETIRTILKTADG